MRFFTSIFFQESNPSGASDKHFAAAECLTPPSQNLGLVIQHFILQQFFFHDSVVVFTPKRIFPDCPFKSKQRPEKFLF